MKLEAFIPRLEALARPSFLENVKRQVAYEGLRLTAQCFATETDPYGQIWPSVNEHRSHHSVLWDTGKLRAGFTAYPTPGGVKFLNDVPYAAVHQYGSRNIVARRMLPVASRGLPKEWKEAVDRIVSREIKRTMKGEQP